MENRTKINALIDHSIKILKKYATCFDSSNVIESKLTAQILSDLVAAKDLLEDEPNIANVVLYEYEDRLVQNPEDLIEDLVQDERLPTFDEFVDENFSASDIIMLNNEMHDPSIVEEYIVEKYREFCKKEVNQFTFNERTITLDLDAI